VVAVRETEQGSSRLKREKRDLKGRNESLCGAGTRGDDRIVMCATD
jgi:hypothetical protein